MSEMAKKVVVGRKGFPFSQIKIIFNGCVLAL
jgi:hypothetical protein